jgi:hypothetical protein
MNSWASIVAQDDRGNLPHLLFYIIIAGGLLTLIYYVLRNK